MKFKGFEPCFNSDAEILVLGSFPSVKSRENAFYYGNPQNRFWRLTAEIFGVDIPLTVDEKKEFLYAHKIALWDIVTECKITGSMDSNIKDYSVADLSEVLNNAPIKKIILNGGKAAEIFKKFYPSIKTTAYRLPSTSPANTRFDKKLWINAFNN